jgi:hypothetical protein
VSFRGCAGLQDSQPTRLVIYRKEQPMKRSLAIPLNLISAAALCAALPGAALAQGAHRHHQRRHAHAHVRIERLMPASAQVPSSGTSPQAPPPTTPAANIGTVTSFANGLLTLTLSDGTTTVSGHVDAHTRIECLGAGASMTAHAADRGGNSAGSGPSDGSSGDQQSGGQQSGDQPEQSPGTGPSQPPVVDQPGSDSNETGSSDDDQNEGGEETGQPVCDSSLLVPGAVVHGAVLSISSSGSVFEEIQLAQ